MPIHQQNPAGWVDGPQVQRRGEPVSAPQQSPETAQARVAESEVTCGAVPVQIEGRLTDGRFFYFRARHRSVTLGLGDSPDDAVGGSGPVVIFDGIGDHAVGWMDVELAQGLLGFLVAAMVREEEIAAESAFPPGQADA